MDKFKMLKKLVPAVFCCSIIFSAHAKVEADEELYFSHLGVNDGLSQSTVNAIIQDNKGLMWIGTREGLDRYDGFAISHEISINNGIHCLEPDKAGNIWAGTDSAIFVLNSHGTILDKIETCKVNTLKYSAPSYMIAGTTSGIRLFDLNSARELQNNLTTTFNNQDISSIQTTPGKILVGTWDGKIYMVLIEAQIVKQIAQTDLKCGIHDIECLESGKFYVASEGQGLYLFDSEGKQIKHYTESNSDLSSNYVRALKIDTFGRLWIGTVAGLNILSEGNFTLHEHSSFAPGSLSNNSVRVIFRDRQDGMWLGTYYKGLNYWHSMRNHFSSLTREKSGSSLSDDIISCIVEDGDAVWIGTNSGGLNRYDTRSGEIEVLSKLRSDIKAIHVDGDYIYIGSHAAGIAKVNKTTGTYVQCGDAKHAKSNVYALLPLDSDRLLAGTLEGLLLYHKDEDKFVEINDLLHNKQIWSLLDDRKNERIWVGLDDRAIALKKAGEGLIYEGSEILTGSRVTNLFKSSSEDVWAGSRTGLFRLKASDGQIETFKAKDGLPSETIHGIEEDSWSRIWVSTDRGLSSITPFSRQIRNFTTEDGLPTNQFNDYSHCRMSDSQIWFGGMNGIALFYPESFSDNIYTPKPLIVDVDVAGEKREVSKEMTFKSNETVITLHFAVPNYVSWRHNSFRYKLDDYDEKWIECGAEGKATYTNLPHGKYTFKVMAANSDDVWSEEEQTMTITILARWYQTVWAQLLFALAILTGIIFVSRHYSQKQRIRHEQEMMEMRTSFFVNLSHELRTPLTLIMAPIKDMLERTDDKWMRKQIKYMDRNAQRLLHLVNQLMDHRSAEIGMFKLHVKEEKLERLVQENFDYFSRLAVTKRLHYSLNSTLDGATGWCDSEFLELILSNLISNAFKYTEKGDIKVTADIVEGKLELSVSDTGKGIDKEQLGKLFLPYYHGLSLVKRLVDMHHGEIKVESEPGKGSCFTVSLPIGDDTYTEEEKTSIEESAPVVGKSTIVEPESEIPSRVVRANEIRSKILIVEDDTDFCNYLRSELEERFDTEYASISADALKAIESNNFDMVIAEMKMDKGDGTALCANIRKSKEKSMTPVILLSSVDSEDAQIEALHCGADGFIAKPFSMSVLTAKIDNMLKRHTKVVEKAKGESSLSTNALTFKPADEEFLNNAIKVVKANMDNVDFSTEDFAREMHVSRSSLHLKIKNITGQSALELIRKVRFEQACKMLKDGRYTINQIADKVGFSSASYFATCFKKYMGCMPSEYIKQNTLHKN